MKVKPLLSCEVDIEKVNFPIYVSTKFDGIRALVIDGVVHSRSLKPIRNKHVQKLFGKPEYNGFDGELVVGNVYSKDVFQNTTSGVMSEGGEPDVTFHVFDLWSIPTFDYEYRQRELQEILLDKDEEYHSVVYTMIHRCKNKEDLLFYLQHEQNVGGEGLIGRNPKGIYKYGRSTPKEQLSIKFKFFVQDEFEVVGFTERMHNSNELTYNELGYADRSSAKDGMIPTDTLGSLILKYKETTFNCGTGFNDEQRKEIWNNKNKYLGKLASIRYMEVGAKDKPRIPSFIWFRDEDDL